MTQEFCFVNATDIDKMTKKRMRRHVMMGKNAGKTVHRRSKKDQIHVQHTGAKEVVRIPMVSIESVDQGKNIPFRLRYYEPLSIYNNVLTGLSFPVEITPHFAETISNFLLYIAEKLYPVKLGVSIEASKYTWMNVLMSDKEAFYCNIALMQACNELFLGDGENSPMAMYHLSNSLTQVRKRLESAEALSDSTIGIVMTLITQEQVRKQDKAARIHMDGLVRMVELRGGLESLDGCLPVLLKACKTDIVFTLQNESPPRFQRDRMLELEQKFASLHLPFDREASRQLVRHSGLNVGLVEVLVDAITTSALFNDLSSVQKIDLYLFQELLITIFYRLLTIPFHPNPSSPPTIEDAYHAGLTLFMTTLFLQYGSKRALHCVSITGRLKIVLQSTTLEREDGLKLWLLMLNCVWVMGDGEADWLLPIVGEQSRKMDLSAWEEARKVVERYPWIGRLHDESARLFWEKARAS